ncbi:hypothetical protein NNC19_00850 [Clostridium sp. SHJSY1]|uniref:hypothetical protein n=1 Tax=Clostridium sp. SHJSY1 TaxID=2942483 RepID=UPI002874608E|nr:hypothetical protein [Clostridium sp. SHJSY1]MDS0524204.1 hypothetical protein [Clostridium sp. SHJSY1]
MIDLIALVILGFCAWILIKKIKRSFNAEKIGKDVVQEYINEKGITITKRLDLSISDGKRIFFIDDKNKRIHDLRISPDDANPVRDFTYEYSDIVKCEVIKDEFTADNYNDLVRHDDCEEEEEVHKFGFRITVDNISSPYIEILTTKSRSKLYRGEISKVTDWVNVINIAIKQGEKLAENR